MTRNRHDHEPRARHHHDSRRNQAKKHALNTRQTRGTRPVAAPEDPAPDHGYQQAQKSDPNVKLGLTET
jgi:hypothetical protein